MVPRTAHVDPAWIIGFCAMDGINHSEMEPSMKGEWYTQFIEVSVLGSPFEGMDLGLNPCSFRNSNVRGRA